MAGPDNSGWRRPPYPSAIVRAAVVVALVVILPLILAKSVAESLWRWVRNLDLTEVADTASAWADAVRSCHDRKFFLRAEWRRYHQFLPHAQMPDDIREDTDPKEPSP